MNMKENTMDAKNENQTTNLPRGTRVLNINDGEAGTILAPRMGRNGRIRGYDVHTADGVEGWSLSEFIVLTNNE